MSITDFLQIFFPDEAEPIWLRSFDSKGLPSGVFGYPQKVETCIAELRTNKTLQKRLRTINQKQGLYFVVNAGGNEDKDITRINAVYCEIDDLLPDPKESIVAQHLLYDACPLQPSIRVETKKSVHAYWLLRELITTENFLHLQQGLIKYFNSDTSIKNLSRVMRVPFFDHVQWDGGYQYQKITIHTCDRDARYSLDELQKQFPYTPPKKAVYRPPTEPLETLESVKAECRARIMQMDSWTSHGKWGCANGVCHNGKGKTGLRVDLASGAITCHSNCSLKTILAAFGLEIPRKDNRKFEYVSRPKQASQLAQWAESQMEMDKERIAISVEHLPEDEAQRQYELLTQGM